MKFGGKKYGTQFINTEEKENQFMHYMHKIAVDATFTLMTAKKGIKRHGKKGGIINVQVVHPTIGH